jgi:anti-sigma-K factor RskA
LGRVYDLNPEQAPEAFDVSAEASHELKERVLASAAPAAEPGTAPASIATAPPLRPQGRVRGGTPARGVEPTPIRRGAWRTPWVAAAAMLIVAVGVTLWALAVQNKYDDQSREMRAQSTEIAQIRTNSNASAFTITATGDGPAQAGGTLFYSPKDQQAVLVLANLPAAKANSVYQLWYIKGSSAPAPGATFKPNADGSLVFKTNASINSFDVVALTEEPAGGSTTPTMPILMTGTVGPAAG